ncbi:unnamed protein product [Paramecium sonneborni]|uniref:Leucine-rich repeat-containing protein 51 n=1 Tax=Paramecium sonneborni TaxID=65129 RepID=A0A8S1MVN1_9CILI|nr:unnamed protein product [Paramecium sonneborni]CAD8081436.1 unnamed protein product [Paramecium sonneborni]
MNKSKTKSPPPGKQQQSLSAEPKETKKLRTALDYSFKEIKKLEELKNKEVKPREGEQWIFKEQKKQENQEVKNDTPKEQVLKQQQSLPEETEPVQPQQQQPQKQQDNKKGNAPQPPPNQLIPQTNLATQLITLQNIPLNGKIIGGKLQENKNQNQQSKFKPELYCQSLILCQNKLTSLSGFYQVMQTVMPNVELLRWIDLSYNQLTTLDYNFKELPHLQSLYLNFNLIKDINELKQLSHLQELRSLKIYGNQIEQIINFRLYIIDVLPQLKRIDSVLISKKERDNSSMIVKVFDFKPQMKAQADKDKLLLQQTQITLQKSKSQPKKKK